MWKFPEIFYYQYVTAGGGCDGIAATTAVAVE